MIFLTSFSFPTGYVIDPWVVFNISVNFSEIPINTQKAIVYFYNMV